MDVSSAAMRSSAARPSAAASATRSASPSSPADEASSACACGSLRRASRALTQLYDDAMAPAGLHLTQFSLLRTLASRGPTRITELAAAKLLDRTALSRNLDPLVARGLVTIVAGKDARTREVALSPAGKAAIRAALPHWKRAQEEVFRRLGATKLQKLIALLGELESLHPGVSARDL
jgi:DNA-binding MarR family transcriptional regulator